MKYKYEIIHTHEEAGLMGAIFRIIFRKKHIYDMHSSLSEQFINFNITKSKLIIRIIRFFEKLIIKNSDCVIVICEHLKEVAKSLYKDAKVIVIENTLNPDYFNYFPKKEDRIDLAFRHGRKMILYIGTFEHYQGIDIVVDAARYLKENGINKGIVFTCIGGNEEQINELREMIKIKNVDDLFYVDGRLSHIEANKLIEEADILLSPRKEGVNTPLKIYSYLYSGKAIIATNLLTHTQILNNDVAILCEAKGEAFGKAIMEILNDNNKAEKLGKAAKKLFEEKYAYNVYKELVKKSLEIVKY